VDESIPLLKFANCPDTDTEILEALLLIAPSERSFVILARFLYW
jgi:hypothetical protein